MPGASSRRSAAATNTRQRTAGVWYVSSGYRWGPPPILGACTGYESSRYSARRVLLRPEPVPAVQAPGDAASRIVDESMMYDAPTLTPLVEGVGLLERAIGYLLGSLRLVTPAVVSNATPCRDWDVRALLCHVNDSLT